MHLISCLLKLVERDVTEREPFQASGKELNAARSAESLALQLFPGRQSQTPREMMSRRAQPTTSTGKRTSCAPMRNLCTTTQRRSGP